MERLNSNRMRTSSHKHNREMSRITHLTTKTASFSHTLTQKPQILGILLPFPTSCFTKRLKLSPYVKTVPSENDLFPGNEGKRQFKGQKQLTKQTLHRNQISIVIQRRLYCLRRKTVKSLKIDTLSQPVTQSKVKEVRFLFNH